MGAGDRGMGYWGGADLFVNWFHTGILAWDSIG